MTTTAAQRLELVPLARLVESPSNHRKKTWGDMKELTESVKAKGVLQPILARPVKGIGNNLLEIVFGHRRFRAAQAAGLDAIPAVVRELSDVEALEANVIENLQRADVHPLEEAEGYEQLLAQKERPLTVDDLAAKVGKSKAYVYGRMKLLSLCVEGRKAFYEGELTASLALLVARIVGAENQKRALKAFAQPHFRSVDELISFREAQQIVHGDFMLALKDAPFKPADAGLVPAAGACTNCPKRTGAQPLLFDDVKSGDVCTDPTCYRQKVDAAWKARTAAAKAEGRQVLPDAEAKKVFNDYGDHGLRYNADLVALDDRCPHDPKGRTWGKLLGKAATEAVVLARDPSGAIRELVPKKATAKLLKAAGHNLREERDAQVPEKDREEMAKAKERDAVEKQVKARLRVLAGEAFDAKEPDRELWDILVDELDADYRSDEDVLVRRFGGDSADAAAKAFEKARPKMTAAQLRAIVLEMLLGKVFVEWGHEDVADRLVKWAGLDKKAVEAAVKAGRKAAAKEKASPPAKGKKTVGKAAARELPRATAEELGAEECLDCGVAADQPSKGCDSCDHGRTKKAPAKKGGSAALAWTEVEGTHRAETADGTYEILPGSKPKLTWEAYWIPKGGSSKALGSHAALSAGKDACQRHAAGKAVGA